LQILDTSQEVKMNEEISVDLVNSIASEKIILAGSGTGELILDSLLENGTLKDIPVINSAFNLYKAGVEIRRNFLIKKIVNFLKELNEAPLDKRQKFIKEMDKKAGGKRLFGETILLLIDRAESLQKPLILGRLTKHLILGNISYEDTTRLSFIVDRAYVSDLNYLLNFEPGSQHNPDIASSLQSAGLLAFSGMSAGNFEKTSNGGVLYELNEYGKMLLKYGLDATV